ncbi:MAG: hypothetical protein WCJ84_00565 [Candidatus Peregrinibacteria bacterium]
MSNVIFFIFQITSKYSNRIRQKVLNLFDTFGTPKIKMGDFLEGSNEYRAKQARARSFFSGKRELNMTEIEKVAEFFNKPLEYFLYEDSDARQVAGRDNNGIMIQNGHGGVVTVTSHDKDLIEQIIGLSEEKKEAIKRLL